MAEENAPLDVDVDAKVEENVEAAKALALKFSKIADGQDGTVVEMALAMVAGSAVVQASEGNPLLAFHALQRFCGLVEDLSAQGIAHELGKHIFEQEAADDAA